MSSEVWRILGQFGIATLTCQGAAAQLDATVIPLNDPTIAYGSQQAANPIAELQEQLDLGDTELAFDERPGIGYLPALLNALHVPVESQLVVFSKTALQAPSVGPQHPRTIFFNDAVAIAFVRSGTRAGMIELAAHDPREGAVFYTLQQLPDAPRLERQNGCLGCHYSHATLGVPGFQVRSVPTASDGQTLRWLGDISVNHSTPIAQRWGGWYVTGDAGTQEHLGNLLIEDKSAHEIPRTLVDTPRDLRTRFATEAYLTPYSDVVAHLVFEHQVAMMNMLTRVGWDARVALADGAHQSTFQRSAEAAVDQLLFVGEAPIGRVEGTSGFSEVFSAAGPYDTKGRSLRQLQLDQRLMRYPCSYMIYSRVFEGLPSIARDAIYRRLWLVLSGAISESRYEHLSRADRQAIVEILVDTKTNLPRYFLSSAQ